jgi:hypothetical protein
MRYFLVTLLLFFTACSTKSYEQTKTKLLTIKTKQFRFSDIAYLRHTNSDLELELFVAGQVFKKITINHLICVSDEGCMSKEHFNEAFLDANYPQNLLQNVLLGKPLLSGKNLRKTDNGFEQHLGSESYDIEYRVAAKEIYFKDRKNHILIKLKELQ